MSTLYYIQSKYHGKRGTKATNGKEMGWKNQKASTIYPSGVAYKNSCLDTKYFNNSNELGKK